MKVCVYFLGCVLAARTVRSVLGPVSHPEAELGVLFEHLGSLVHVACFTCSEAFCHYVGTVTVTSTVY